MLDRVIWLCCEHEMADPLSTIIENFFIILPHLAIPCIVIVNSLSIWCSKGLQPFCHLKSRHNENSPGSLLAGYDG